VRREGRSGQAGDPPSLTRDEALGKAVDYAKQAKELAEGTGMKGCVKRADALLAKIGRENRARRNAKRTTGWA